LLEGLILELDLRPFGDYVGASLEGTFGLLPIMLGLDVGVEGGVGEISLAASALVVPAFFVLARPS